METVDSLSTKFDSLLAAILAKLSVGADHTELDALKAELAAVKVSVEATQTGMNDLGAKFDKAIAQFSA